MGYFDFIGLVARCKLVLTDSGGIQEETTYLGIPCFTMRENTERPSTTSVGTNILIGSDLDRLRSELENISADKFKRGSVPAFWDGRAAERIVADIEAFLS
jgi:UDP-N-acetylglucosamine 2-epimerase (non-hydrolysing)